MPPQRDLRREARNSELKPLFERHREAGPKKQKHEKQWQRIMRIPRMTDLGRTATASQLPEARWRRQSPKKESAESCKIRQIRSSRFSLF
jgi:hypothetical protein